jgi:NAD(P) transhydrogenase subunit alpha
MQLSIPAETAPRERRVAIAPDSIGRFKKLGIDVVVERGAGVAAGFRDDAYAAAGARVAADAAATYAGATIVAKVQPPSDAELALIPEGATVISLMRPGHSAELVAALGRRKLIGLALELVPRITRAQSMDILSSQATVAGYKAVLLGAERLPKFLPMLTTAAGNITPAKAFVLGAGVAGLQAIATARRLGAVVSAFDVRAAVREQVQSLGATFVAAEIVTADAETAGGYAKEQSADQQSRTLAAIGGHIRDVDLVIATAQIPGKPAPRLITAEMVRSMRPGSVIVDIAAETGGNCELSSPGHDHRAPEPAEHRPVSRQPDVRPQHLRAAQAAHQGRPVRLEPERRDSRENDSEIVDGWMGGSVTAWSPRSNPPSHQSTNPLIHHVMLILELYVFVLAGFVGYMVIQRVPPLLHTPLMAATNAISGISLVGSLIAAGSAHNRVATTLGFIAVVCATSNIVGGFLITDRMLKMFRKDGAEAAAERRAIADRRAKAKAAS